jgi:hypothetical protein
LNGLLENPSIVRLSGLADGQSTLQQKRVIISLTPPAGAFRAWAPKLHQYYLEKLSQLREKVPGLRQNFGNSIWAAATFNFGPQTVTFEHRNCANLAFGWCAVTALGSFDPKRGGHLTLWDMGLVIEFPPGSTILIPSAVLRHSNVALQPGDVRMSFTQYAAGGLFRWVDQGFRTAAMFSAKDPEGKKRFDQESEKRWAEGLSLYSTLPELKAWQ